MGLTEQASKKDEEIQADLDFDEILPLVGECGRYQIILQSLLSLAVIPVAFPSFIMYFAAQQPSWRCARNSSICVSNESFSADNMARCGMPRSAWVFDKPLSYSLVTQFDIYCSGEWKIHMANSMFFIGACTGALLLGWLTDNYGRRRILFPSYTAVLVFSFISAFSTNIYFFLVCRYVVGFFIPVASVQMFVIIAEMTGQRFRVAACVGFWSFTTWGNLIMTATAYLLPEWRALLMACSLPYFVLLVVFIFIPESVRWLMVKGRTEDAMALVERIARCNKKTLPKGLRLKVADSRLAERKTKISDLFNTREKLLGNAVLGYAWFVSSLLFFGISLAADDLGGSFYRNFVLGTLVEFPASATSAYVLRKARKRSTIILMLCSSICCVIVAFVSVKVPNNSHLRVAFGTFGKYFCSSAFDSIYVWSSELYPTNSRAIGMGFLQIASRVGGTASPWVAKALRRLHPAAPFFAMGFFGASSSMALCYLPETKGKIERVQYEQLPEEDAIGDERI